MSRWAWWSLLGLTVALAVAIVALTPWAPRPGLELDAGQAFSPRQVARAAAFHGQLRLPSYLGLAAGVAAALVLGLTTAGSRFVRSTRARLRAWPLQVVAAVAAVSLVVHLVRLPFTAGARTVLLRYGLSTQTWLSWALDSAKTWALTTAVASTALVLLVGLARRFGPWWFVPGAAVGAGLVMLLSYAHPVIVEPLYSQFTPMSPSPLRASLLDLAERDGVEVDQVLVADASRRTTALNAYVSGFGSTRRIVVYDTLLDKASDSQVRLVVAHELGHAERRDVLVGSAVAALGTATGVVALALALRWRPLLRRAGARSAADPAVTALVIALVSAATVLVMPLQNLVSRQVEARADVHAIDLTADPAGFVAMQRHLALTNLTDLEPPLVDYLWSATHPTPPQRIAFARQWAQQHAGDVLRGGTGSH